MAIIAGQAVRGDNFWDRPYLMEDIMDIIKSGGHILLVAPRRVGKTSLMYRVLDTLGEEYIVIYVDTEAETTVNAFWEKLFNTLADDEFLGSIKTKAKKLFDTIKTMRLSEAGVKGVKFGDAKSIHYAKVFENLLQSYDGDKKLIIMMDEFSQTIENIIQHESTAESETLLREHRELRQNHRLSDKVSFIYAGSIGLESVVGHINASKHINDLESIPVPPLEKEEAKKFASHLFRNNDIAIDESAIAYMLEKIEWHIPFYIQLIAQELKRLYRRKPIIDTIVIDKAIGKVLEHKKDFVHWQERLASFSLEGKAYAIEVLNLISTEKTTQSSELSNIATKHTLEASEAKDIIHALKYDGYINNSDDARIYRFNSPILRTWWYNNVAN